MPRVNIGSNSFQDVSIPLVLENRYFLLEDEDGKDIWSVFTFLGGKPVLEILRNVPQGNPLSVGETNATGIVTISDPKTGQFLYKLRPGLRNSAIFGSIDGCETEIHVADREIRVGTNVFSNNTISGFPVGIMVRGGGIAIGAGLPPEFLSLVAG